MQGHCDLPNSVSLLLRGSCARVGGELRSAPVWTHDYCERVTAWARGRPDGVAELVACARSSEILLLHAHAAFMGCAFVARSDTMMMMMNVASHVRLNFAMRR